MSKDSSVLENIIYILLTLKNENKYHQPYYKDYQNNHFLRPISSS